MSWKNKNIFKLIPLIILQITPNIKSILDKTNNFELKTKIKKNKSSTKIKKNKSSTKINYI